MITVERLDFVSVPSQDADRAVRFYRDVLGLRPDEHADYELWAGDTCIAIWEPEKVGRPFAPQRNGHLALRVPDVAAAQAELEAAGVEFVAPVFDTGVCNMAFFHDPDGNDVMLHHRHTPRA